MSDLILTREIDTKFETFFPFSNCSGYKFYFSPKTLSKLSEDFKQRLTTLIHSNNGLITNYNNSEQSNIITVIPDFSPDKLDNNHLRKLFEKPGKILLSFCDHLEELTYKNKCNPLPVDTVPRKYITVSAVFKHLSFFGTFGETFFYKDDIYKQVKDKRNVLYICCYTIYQDKVHKRTYFYEFESEDDVPYYNVNAPEKFAIFSSNNEMSKINRHLEKKKLNGAKQPEKKKEIAVKVEASPICKHGYCGKCNMRYDNYFEHIKSVIHSNKSTFYYDNFRRINETFQRVYLNNVNKNLSKENGGKIIEFKNENNSTKSKEKESVGKRKYDIFANEKSALLFK